MPKVWRYFLVRSVFAITRQRVPDFFAILLLLVSTSACADEFSEWLKDIQRQALDLGVSESTVALLSNLEPDARVIGFDRRQPEFVQSFDEYLTARVTDSRIRTAQALFGEHRQLLQQIGDRYGVDPQYLIAFWGLESSFGRYQGSYSVLRSLATLAHDPRRSAFFTDELFDALRILDEGHIPPDEFVGGWAGAMGQNQFLPSSFRRYAQDFDGDGRKNIWSSEVDVWASIANYLSVNGWRPGAGWGSRADVSAPLDLLALAREPRETTCRAVTQHTTTLSFEKWQELGVTPRSTLDPVQQWAMIVPGDGDTQHYLVGGNFRTILHYNCANKYAVSVGLLADAILAGSSP